MNTPNRRPSLQSSSDAGPPASFLRNLLHEIKGTGTPIVTQNDPIFSRCSSGLSSARRSPNKRPSSVWVGGTALARDAREKLRAADEARSKKTNTLGTDSASSSSNTPPTRPSSSSPRSDRSYTRSLVGRKNQALDNGNTLYESDHGETIDNIALPCPRPVLGKLHIPSSRFITKSTPPDEHANEAVSPLMFVDSEISSSPSSIDPPTSASTSATDATTLSSCHGSQTNSPSKREHSPDPMASRSPLKKMRAMTLPSIRIVTPHQGARLSPPLMGLAGDNRHVIREKTFTERVPAGDQQVPEPSSFRPHIASPDGLAPFPAQNPRLTIPAQPLQRRSPSKSPEAPETPSYARPLHLFDTTVVVGGNERGDEWIHDISIYKHVHGEEWKRNALCSHCFRIGGTCNRIMTYGYESCGRDEPLDSHYWETTANPSY